MDGDRLSYDVGAAVLAWVALGGVVVVLFGVFGVSPHHWLAALGVSAIYGLWVVGMFVAVRRRRARGLAHPWMNR